MENRKLHSLSKKILRQGQEYRIPARPSCISPPLFSLLLLLLRHFFKKAFSHDIRDIPSHFWPPDRRLWFRNDQKQCRYWQKSLFVLPPPTPPPLLHPSLPFSFWHDGLVSAAQTPDTDTEIFHTWQQRFILTIFSQFTALEIRDLQPPAPFPIYTWRARRVAKVEPILSSLLSVSVTSPLNSRP